MTHYFQAGLHFTLFLLNSGLVLWIFRARKRIPLQSICMALCACFAVWSLSEVVIALAARRETAQLFCKIGSVGWIFTPTIFLIFSLAYTDNLRKYRSMWFHSIVYGPYLVFLVSSWMGNLCNVVRFGNLWESSFQPLTYLFCLYCAITACYSFLALYRFFRSATVPIKKRRTMVIIATSFLTYVPIQVTEIYFQLLSIHLPIRFGAFFTIVWIGGVAWAILRFKFLEITTAVVADAIIDAMSEALFLVDNDGKIMSCNRAAEILTEYNKAELRGRPVMAFFNDGAVLLPIPRSDAGTGITARECTVMSQCGGSTSVLVSLSPVIDEEAAVAGYVLTARDISVWKKFEEKLRKNHEQWMLAINGSQDGIWDWDIHNDKMFLSPNWKRMIGYEDNELPNEVATFKDRIHPEDRERVQAIIDRFIQGIVKQYSVEFRFRHKNGTFRWILARAEALRDGSGIAYRMAGSHSDITDRKEIQEQLLRRNMAIENERMNLEIIFDSAQVGLMLINNERVVTRANNALASIVGSEASRLLDKRPGEGLCCAVIATTGDQCGSTPQCRSCPIRLLLSTVLDDKVPVIGVEFCKEFSIHGTTVSLWLDLNGCPVVINDVPHALVSIVDVTVRKNMEISLAKARDDAEAAARAKGEFLANMSHEIRTPMNSILGMLELVCDNDLSAEQRSYAEIARSSGESLLSIINDILDFSRIEAQELKLDSIAFDVRAMLEDTACLLAVKAHEKGIELNCMVAPDVPTWIVGDPGRLRQVLINLGGNAVKFTGRGAVTIRADIDKEDDTSVTMRFAIIDTGIGIPAGMTGRLFKPFSQVDGSITRRFGGTGLGLAISRELVQLMGGTIEVESEEGKGSTFRFVVTFEKARPFKQTASDAPGGAPEGTKVLIIDEHDEYRTFLVAQLASWGLRAEGAADAVTGREALSAAFLNNTPYAIALIDRFVGGLDGAEIGRSIKTAPDVKEIKLIMMTAFGRRGEGALFESIGFSAYLTKPLRSAQLRECLKMVAGESQQQKALVTRHTIAEKLKLDTRILIVEDIKTNQIVVVKVLEKLGFNAEIAGNGKEALTMIADRKFDLVLMDCQMPVMDGYEATRRIRAGEAGATNKGVPIIAMTANAMQGDREPCIAAGMDDFCTKPIHTADLKMKIDKWTKSNNGDYVFPEAVKSASGMSTDRPVSEVKPLTFDRNGLLLRIMGDEGLVPVLAETFLGDMPAQLAALREAVDARDYAFTRQLAHRIKGAAANIGGMAVHETAAQLEKTADAGEPAAIAGLLEELIERFEELEGILKNVIA